MKYIIIVFSFVSSTKIKKNNKLTKPFFYLFLSFLFFHLIMIILVCLMTNIRVIIQEMSIIFLSKVELNIVLGGYFGPIVKNSSIIWIL